jgi:thioredoxin reductase (NADPH)
MEARVRKTENITILMNHDTVEVLGDEQVVTGVKALNKLQMKNLRFQLRVSSAIGHKPNTDIFKDFLTLDETGYIINVVGTAKQI